MGRGSGGVVLDLDGGRVSSQDHRNQIKPLRLQCGWSLSEIYRKTAETPTDAVFLVLKKYTKDGDYDIELVAGEALGNSTLSNKKRRELEKHRRLERSAYTADDE